MSDTTELTAPADTTAPPEPVKITLDGPNDWLAAAAGHRVRYPHSRFGQHERRQLDRTLAYLRWRVPGITADKVTVERAATILRAGIDAPEGERDHGIRARAHDESCAAAMAELEHEDCECWCHVPVIEPTVVTPPRKRKPKAEAADEAKAEEAQA